MKNLHLIPTSQPSRLGRFIDTNNLFIRVSSDIPRGENVNIYITNDEQIKEGDWVLMFDDFGNLFICDKPQQYLGIEKGHHLNKGLRKIILTTDQDLIKNGVQAIGDEFLEWFVKNPNCEKVEVNDWLDTNGNIAFGGDKRYQICNHLHDKIIITKKEPKQETLEEAMKRLSNIVGVGGITDKHAFMLGVFWQQERSYSEEDMKQFAFQCVANFLSNNDNKVEMSLVEIIMDRNNKKFEQFKNKNK